MSQYRRTIVIDEKNRAVVEEIGGRIKLKDDLVAEVIVSNCDLDDSTDCFTSLDFTSWRSRVTIKKDFTAIHPFSPWVLRILKILGIKLDPAISIVVAAMYEESGFNEFSREECDKMFLNTVLQQIGNGFVRAVVYDVLMMVVGNNYRWNSSSEQISVANLEPIWN